MPGGVDIWLTKHYIVYSFDFMGGQGDGYKVRAGRVAGEGRLDSDR